MRNYTPFFPEDSNNGYSIEGNKFKTSVSNKFNTKDLYDGPELAEERAYNIGCSGYRSVLVNAKGIYKYAPCSTKLEYFNIMKVMQPLSRKREYYAFDPTDNIFDIRDSFNNDLKEGFDYKDKIMEKTLSNVIFRDPNKESILKEMQKIIFGLIESVKQIKNFFNYTVPKNNKRVF